MRQLTLTLVCAGLWIMHAQSCAAPPDWVAALQSSAQLGTTAGENRCLFDVLRYRMEESRTTLTSRWAYLIGGADPLEDFHYSMYFYGNGLRDAALWTVDPGGQIKKLDKANLVQRLANEEGLVYSDHKTATWYVRELKLGSIVCGEQTIEFDHVLGCMHVYLQDARWDVDSLVCEYTVPNRWTVRMTPIALGAARINQSGQRAIVTGLKQWQAEFLGGTYEQASARLDIEVFPDCTQAPPQSWQDIARELSERWSEIDRRTGKHEYTEAIRTSVDSVLESFEKNVRYVAVELGEGNWIPHKPRDVLANKYGDCKDLSLALCSLLEQCNVECYPVLVRTGRETPFFTNYPYAFQFDHAITAMIIGGDTIYHDPTANGYDFGALPQADCGANALWIKDGTSLIRLPDQRADGGRTHRLTGTLDSLGRLAASVELDYAYLGQQLDVRWDTEKALQALIREKVRDELSIEIQQSGLNETTRTAWADIAINNFARVTNQSLYCVPYPFAGTPDSVKSDLPAGYFVHSTRPETTMATLRVPPQFDLTEIKPVSYESDAGSATVSVQLRDHELTVTWTKQFRRLHFEPEERPQLDSLLSAIHRSEALILKFPAHK